MHNREKDAWESLTYHFSDENGLLAQIESGKEIGIQAIRDVERALEILQEVWRTRRTVPKREISLLWSVFPRLEQAMSQQPAREQELRAVWSLLSTHMQILLTIPLSTMSEEDAIDVLRQHLVGGPSFGQALYMGYTNQIHFQPLLHRLEQLKPVLSGQQEIPKRLSHALLNVWQFPWSEVTRSEDDHPQVSQMKQQLVKAIEDLFAE